MDDIRTSLEIPIYEHHVCRNVFAISQFHFSSSALVVDVYWIHAISAKGEKVFAFQ